MDAFPQMLSLRHMAGLTLSAFAGKPAGLPLVIGIFMQLTVDSRTGFRELVTMSTEPAVFKGFVLNKSPMYRNIGRTIAGRRTVSTM
jgi:hypothetical protein